MHGPVASKAGPGPFFVTTHSAQKSRLTLFERSELNIGHRNQKSSGGFYELYNILGSESPGPDSETAQTSTLDPQHPKLP